MIERSTVGGTCVNIGCVPSKTLIRAAEAKHHALHTHFAGISSRGLDFDFSTIINEKDKLVDSLREAKYKSVLQSYDLIDFIAGEASFSSENTVRVGDRNIAGDLFLIATGASIYIPPIPGLDKVNYLTSTTAFELQELPASMAIIGGRYIALELAQMFQRLGTKVTILQRSDRILPTEDADLTDALTGYLESEDVSILTNVHIQNISEENFLSLSCQENGKDRKIEVEQLVIATGRTPDTTALRLEETGIHCNTDKTVVTNEYNQTNLPHIYAAGDVIGHPAFVYTAAYEGKLAVENAFGGNTKKRDYSIVPYVVFTDPQVAGIGLNEQTAKIKGIEVDVSKLSLDNVPRCLAARDTRGFIKLLKEKGTDQLVGASILAPEGSELLMEISLAMQYNIPVTKLATMFHPYLTLGEGIKLAAQTFNKDVKKLSCCAS